MVSNIDATKPAAGVPARKQDLRNSLLAAKNEIEALQSFVNVKDAQFGAVGDDATDDTLAIRAATEYALANNISTVYFPKGIYRVMPQVDAAIAPESALEFTITDSLQYIGSAPGDVTLRFRTRGNTDPTNNWDIQSGGALWRGRCLVVNGLTGASYANYFKIKNIELDGGIVGANENITTFPADPLTGSGWDSTNQGFLYANNFREIHIENVVAHNFRGEIYYSGGEADTRVFVINSKAYSSNGNGWNFGKCVFSVYDYCEAYDLGNDILELAVNGGIIVTNCNFHDTKAFRIGQQTSATNFGDWREHTVIIKNNTLWNMDQVGIEFYGRNAIIQDNLLIDCGTSDGIFGGVGSIRVSQGASGSLFEDNRQQIHIRGNVIRAMESNVPTAISLNGTGDEFNHIYVENNTIGNAAGSPGLMGEAIRLDIAGTSKNIWIKNNHIEYCGSHISGSVVVTSGDTNIPGTIGDIVVEETSPSSGGLAQQTISPGSNAPKFLGQMDLVTDIANLFLVPTPVAADHQVDTEVVLRGLTSGSLAPIKIPMIDSNFRCPQDRFLYTGTRLKLKFDGTYWREIDYVDTRASSETSITSVASTTIDGLGRSAVSFAIASGVSFDAWQGIPEGSVVFIRASNANVTLVDNSVIKTGTGANLVLDAEKTYTARVLGTVLCIVG